MSQHPPAPTVQPSPPFSVVLGNTFYVGKSGWNQAPRERKAAPCHASRLYET